MKSTKNFKNVIEEYLTLESFIDPLFGVSFNSPDKNIDDCIKYILNTVKNSGNNGFTDSEVFNMAKHYYDEKDIKVGANIDMKVVVNHLVKLTDEEIEKLKQETRDKVTSEERAKILNRTTVVKKDKLPDEPTLF